MSNCAGCFTCFGAVRSCLRSQGHLTGTSRCGSVSRVSDATGRDDVTETPNIWRGGFSLVWLFWRLFFVLVCFPFLFVLLFFPKQTKNDKTNNNNKKNRIAQNPLAFALCSWKLRGQWLEVLPKTKKLVKLILWPYYLIAVNLIEQSASLLTAILRLKNFRQCYKCFRLRLVLLLQ